MNVLIEFLELSQLLGTSYFTFYDFQISENVSNLLKYYEGKRLAQVLSWKLPSYIGESVMSIIMGKYLPRRTVCFDR